MMDQPIGLQRLAALHCLEVHSTRTWTGSKYEIRESSGELLYGVKEEPRPFFSTGLSLDIALLDDNGVEVINLHRKSNMFGPRKLRISMEGALASLVQQKNTFTKLVFEVRDLSDTPVYIIKGHWQQAFDYKFELTTLDKKPLGAIIRKWQGWRKELMSTREDFTITFPQDLEMKYKAACIATCVHIIDTRRQERP